MNPVISDTDINKISLLGLAHIGDAVYEILARSWLIINGRLTSRRMHADTIGIVRAQAQAQAVQNIYDALTEEERGIYRRGRNTRTNSIPKGAGAGTYHAATGLEALFGWLYLKNRRDRINELFEMIMEVYCAP